MAVATPPATRERPARLIMDGNVKSPKPAIVYPDSDGMPMADNTLQFNYIVSIKSGFDALYKDDPNVFVAGDLLWYPVEGDPATRIAPDVLLAFGRPKGYRGSYRQWEEGGIAPQVVFEILSPGNRLSELTRKLRFYERFGVQEYYIYDPDRGDLSGWVRRGNVLDTVEDMAQWVSPLTGVRFQIAADGALTVIDRNGEPFLAYLELVDRLNDQQRLTDEQRARADEAQQRAERLAARLRALGIDPDAP